MLQGIDISHWQERTPSLGGLDFLIARATYGTDRDPRYKQHVTAAKARHLVVGAYHFGRHGDVPGQIKAFVDTAGEVDLYALDLEKDAGFPTMTQAEARDWIAGVRAALNRPIGYYHSTSGYSDVGQDWRWVADYRNIQKPPIKFNIWQWQGCPLDRDHYRGTRAQLIRLGGGKDAVGLHVTLPSAIVTGSLAISKDCDAIRVADGEHFKVPKDVKRPAVTVTLTGGLTSSGFLVDLHGDELHFIRNGPDVMFTASAGVDCTLAVAAERDRVMTAAQAAVDAVG